MNKIIKFIDNNTNTILNVINISCDTDEKDMEEKVRETIIESLKGGKKFTTGHFDESNINNWSNFGCSGHMIIVEDVK